MADSGNSQWVNTWGYGINLPEELSYSDDLMYVRELDDNKVRIGISEIGTRSVKALLFIRVKPKKGAEVKKGDTLGFVETSKRVWEIICPLSGKVAATNKKIKSGNTLLIKTDTYGEGWIIDLEKGPETDAEMGTLRSGATAETKAWIKEQVEAIVPLKEGA